MGDKDYKSKIEENKTEKQFKILETAFKLFTEKGINNTSIQDIVDNAGVAKGTFYLYFKDKYELQDYLIVKKANQLFNDALLNLNKTYINNFEDQIIFVINYIIDELVKNPLLLKFINKNLSFGVYNEKISKLIDDKNIGIKELFNKGVIENNIKLINPDVTLFMIIELVGSTCFSSILKGEPLTIEEFKPFLYQTIRTMISN